ncbi:MAG: signal peptide peptidase SppA [Candidatus Rokubacteria bacterium]|nr:signal peptide peptidase SppA [Candidatus Rokubacteria bacterium]
MRNSPLKVIAATLGIFIGVVVVFLMLGRASLRGGEGGGPALFGARVAIVELEGMILEVDDLVRELKGHRDNPGVKAVVLRVNSPGGVVGPTQELHQALMRVREAGKPVVASLGSVAASGGYYAAVAADRIYANPGTLTGSIGVIMQMANVENLFKKVGVDYIVVKAGQYKDIGSFSRPMTSDERRVVQSLLDNVHGQFIDAVAQGRKMDRAEVQTFADGRVFSGVQAKDLRMVDALGSLEDAVNEAAKLAGLALPPAVVRPTKRFSLFDLIRSQIGLQLGLPMTPSLPSFRTLLYLMD